MLGAVGVNASQVTNEITIDGIKFTAIEGGEVPEIKFIFKDAGAPEIGVNGDTISIQIGTLNTYAELLTALQGDSDVLALVDLTTVDGEYNGGTYIDGYTVNLAFSGGAEGIKAQIDIGGLIIQAATAGTNGNNIGLIGVRSNLDDATVAINPSTNTVNNDATIRVTFGNQATLANMRAAIDGNTASQNVIDADALVDFVGTATTFESDGTVNVQGDYNPNALLVDLLPRIYSVAETITVTHVINPTADNQYKAPSEGDVYKWTTTGSPENEDFTINPIDPDIL